MVWLATVLCAGTALADLNERLRLRSVDVAHPAEQLDVSQGTWSSGSLQDLFASDRAVVEFDASAQMVEFSVLGTGAAESPLAVSFSIEAQVTGPSGPALQSIALRDFETMALIPLDDRWLSPGSSVTTSVFAPPNVGRFLQLGTRRLEAHVTYQWGGTGGAPAVEIDALGWQSRVRATRQVAELRGYDAASLNTSQDWIRTVFDLGPDRMLGTPDGVRLEFDVADPGPFDYTFRSELRETNNSTYPRPGTTQVYRMRLDVLELPDLYGPVTIFQRFSVFNDGPDLEVELTGANQFSNAVPGDLQVVAFGNRLRLGKFLKAKNDLAVAIYNDANGGYRVSLNGEVLHEAEGLDTRASTQGSWTQFGLYPHGLHDTQNRADQIASGSTRAAFLYQSYSKLGVRGELDLQTITTVDQN